MTESAAAPAALAPLASVGARSDGAPVRATIQARGLLLAVRPSDGIVLHASTSVRHHLGLEPEDVLGKPLSAALGRDVAVEILRHVASVDDLEPSNPLVVQLAVPRGEGSYYAILHRPLSRLPAPFVVVELEPVEVTRQLSVPAVYGAVRRTLADLERAGSTDELFEIAVVAVHELTGFDRVTLNRLDGHGNAEVVAEAHSADLAPSLGVHFPAGDIPPDARTLYRRSRVHHVSDVNAEPSQVLAVDLPEPPAPLDLAGATLRAPSQAQLKLHRSRGVRAALRVALLYEGVLWGVLDCHHYSGPRAAPYDVRVALELIGSALCAHRAAQLGADRDAELRRQERVLAHLAADSRDETVPLGIAITRSGWMRRLVSADSVIVRAEGRVTTAGHAPDDGAREALIRWVAGAGEEVVATDCLREAAPDVAAQAPNVAGVLGIALPDGQVVIWLRDEVQRRVEWGGDPRTSLPARSDDAIRTTLRPSLARWREVVDGHSLPWTEDQVDSAAALRGHLVEALYLRGRKELRATEELQRSLLPHDLPSVAGWTVEARYEPAGSGLVGGDWYDAIVLPSGHLAVVVGDVTGSGLQAAATMGQLRTSLRTLLVDTCSAHEAVQALLDFVQWTLPGQVATLTVAILDPVTGVAENVSLGHPPLLVVEADGSARWTSKAGAPPLGLAKVAPPVRRVEVPAGGTLVLYSDGLVERRDESIVDGLERLATSFGAAGTTDVDVVVRTTRDERSADDATLLVIHRED